jgi:hypothetical protein
MLDKLRGLNGKDFAKQYMDDQVSAHKQAVSLFQRYGKGGDNEPLKGWAAQTPPTLQQHLDMAQGIYKNMWLATATKVFAVSSQTVAPLGGRGTPLVTYLARLRDERQVLDDSDPIERNGGWICDAVSHRAPDKCVRQLVRFKEYYDLTPDRGLRRVSWMPIETCDSKSVIVPCENLGVQRRVP